MISFKEKVYQEVKRIPKGKTATYKEVAVLAGRPLAWRAVGNILNKNFDKKIPCHRVIRSDGKLGGYNRDIVKKKLLLEMEKVKKIKSYFIFFIISLKNSGYSRASSDKTFLSSSMLAIFKPCINLL